MKILDSKFEKVIDKNVRILKKVLDKEYEYAIVLGSGLNSLVDEVEVHHKIAFKQLYKFPKASVKGHEGNLIFGTLHGKNVIVQQGRVHYYEGHDMRTVTLLMRIYAKLNVKKVILTNAAGAVNEEYNESDVMLINDHIGMFMPNPLIGKNIDSLGERFPSMTNIYERDVIAKVLEKTKNKKKVRVGTYTFMQGPSYETYAEVNALRTLGTDAVGMSTVPEAVVAKHSGMKVFAMSCITNTCKKDSNPTHEEVVKNADTAKEIMKEVINIVMEVM